MSRPNRHDSPGHLYHVMNRGPMKRPIFTDDHTRGFFIARVAEQVKAKRIRLFAYCFMDTHFHALIESVDGDMQGAMQRAESRYCAAFNLRTDRNGNLVQRYLSPLIESTAHLLSCIGYIDRNPVSAGICTRAIDYPHSSASALASGRRVPKWLDRSIVEDFLEGCPSGRDRVEHYECVFHHEAAGVGKLAEARLESSRPAEDELSNLLWESDAWRRDWLLRRAAAVDGFALAAPTADVASVVAAIEGEVADFKLSRGRATAARVATVGLFRELCGLRHARSAEILGVGTTTAWTLYKQHVAEVSASERYLDFVARVAGRALRLCFGGGLGIERARELAEADLIGRRRRRAEAAIASEAAQDSDPKYPPAR